MRTCQHYMAVETSATEGRQLEDGRWEYSKKYQCPTCGVSFVEKHTQPVASARPRDWDRQIVLI